MSRCEDATQQPGAAPEAWRERGRPRPAARALEPPCRATRRTRRWLPAAIRYVCGLGTAVAVWLFDPRVLEQKTGVARRRGLSQAACLRGPVGPSVPARELRIEGQALRLQRAAEQRELKCMRAADKESKAAAKAAERRASIFSSRSLSDLRVDTISSSGTSSWRPSAGTSSTRSRPEAPPPQSTANPRSSLTRCAIRPNARARPLIPAAVECPKLRSGRPTSGSAGGAPAGVP